MIEAVVPSRWTTCAAALVAAALVAGLVAARTGAHAQEEGAIPGGIYAGTIVDTSGVCDEGDLIIGEGFSLRLNPHGTRIVELTVNEVTYMGSSIGPYVVPGDVRIEEDGSFQGDTDVSGVATLHFEGRFEGDAVSGSFGVEVSGTVECAGTFTAQGSPPPERPPTTFEREIDMVGEDCGGGTILVTVSGDRLSVIAIEVEGFNAEGIPASGSATFDEGAVPIAEDWTFGWAYFPGREIGQEIAVSGRFASEALFLLSGAVTVSPSTCGPVPLRVMPMFLGRGGTGPTSPSNTTLFWAAILGAAGLAAFAAGVALRRRVPSRRDG